MTKHRVDTVDYHRDQLTASIMATVQIVFLLLLSCMTASAHPPRKLPACRVVQTDAFCSERSLSAAPDDLPHAVRTLDLSRNQLQNLTLETLAFRTDFQRLNLHANRIQFIQPGLFENMTDLKVLDLSRNHLNLLTGSKTSSVGVLTAVESLDLSGNGLYTGMSDVFLANSPSLQDLSLNGNSITKIAHDTFSGSAALRRISLHNNVILEIEDGAFESLDRLAELDLSKNSIACITDFNLCNLKTLNLSKNSMELFQSTASADVYKLVRLDLSENKMPYFPLLPRNNVLEFLDVSRNRLQSVNVSGSPEKTTRVVFNRLRYLDMSYNQLKGIPESFWDSMGSLEVLNVSSNCISEFSVTGDRLQTVRIIHLSFNSLQSLTFGENSLPSLEKLFLTGNDLTTLDLGIFQTLPSVTHLHLQQNNLSVCSSDRDRDPPGCASFSGVRTLQFLDLSENNLRTLPANAFAGTPLRWLDLSLNPGLDMDKDSLAGLERSLVHLDLSTNRLTALPLWSKDSSIESLNLQNNKLVTLEYSAVVVLEHSLKTLYVGSNPLSCCSNLDFLHMVQRSAVVVPDIETVTCVHEEYSEPVYIVKVTAEMCPRTGVQNYVVPVVVLVIAAVVVLALLARFCHARKRKHERSFNA